MRDLFVVPFCFSFFRRVSPTEYSSSTYRTPALLSSLDVTPPKVLLSFRSHSRSQFSAETNKLPVTATDEPSSAVCYRPLLFELSYSTPMLLLELGTSTTLYPIPSPPLSTST